LITGVCRFNFYGYPKLRYAVVKERNTR